MNYCKCSIIIIIIMHFNLAFGKKVPPYEPGPAWGFFLLVEFFLATIWPKVFFFPPAVGVFFFLPAIFSLIRISIHSYGGTDGLVLNLRDTQEKEISKQH